MPTTNLDSSISTARAALEAGDIASARQTLAHLYEEKALEAAEHRPDDFWRDAAAVLRDAGMWHAARRAWQQAETTGVPGDVCHTQQAVCHLLEGNYAEARDLLQIEVEASGRENPVLLHLFATAHLETGQGGAALSTWQRALKCSAQERCPLSTEPMYLALGVMAIERWVAAHPCVQEATPPENPRHAPGAGQAARMRHIEQAIEKREIRDALEWIAAERADVEGKPDEMVVLFHAWALAEAEQWSQAREVMLDALDTEEPTPSARSFYGWCLARSGEPELALRVLEQVEERGPDDFFVHYFRGVACLQQGRRLEAFHAFRGGFTRFFYDTYHCIVLPLWDKAAGRMESEQQTDPTRPEPLTDT